MPSDLDTIHVETRFRDTERIVHLTALSPASPVRPNLKNTTTARVFSGSHSSLELVGEKAMQG